MGEIEKYGTGFIRIREWMSEYPHLALSIEDLGDFTRVKIEKLGNVTENVTENRFSVIIQLIETNNKLSIDQIAENISVTR
jgi:predicted HTH transcriptional regulator